MAQSNRAPFFSLEPVESRLYLALAEFGDARSIYDSYGAVDVGTFAAPAIVDYPNLVAPLGLLVGTGNGESWKYYASSGSPIFPRVLDQALFGGEFPDHYQGIRLPVDSQMGAVPELVNWFHNTSGEIDLIAGDMDGTIHLYLEQNSLQTDTPLELPDHPGTYAKVKMVDWNGDWKEDLVIGVTGDVVVYLNSGEGGVSDPPIFDTAGIRLGLGFAGQNSPDVADLDNDGLVDLIVAGETSVRFYKNIGTADSPQFDGTFTTIFSDAPSPITRMEVADWNGDHVEDLFYGTADGRMFWREQIVPTIAVGDAAPIAEGDQGTSILEFPVTLSAASGRRITVNWRRGDRLDIGDLYWAGSAGGYLEFAPGETSKVLQIPVDANDAAGPDQQVLVRLEGAYGAEESAVPGLGVVLDDDRDPARMRIERARVEIAPGDNTPGNADGTDFGTALRDHPITRTYTVHNDGSGLLLTGEIVLPEGFTLFDSLAPILKPGESESFTVGIGEGGDGTYSGLIRIPNLSAQVLDDPASPDEYSFAVTGRVIGPQWSMIAGHDMNADGETDLIWRHNATGENVVQLMNGKTPTTVLSLPSVATDWALAGIGDFNSDGTGDMVWRNLKTGVNLVWIMSGRKPSRYEFLPQVADLNSSIVGVADFTGDSKPDLLWCNAITGKYSFWAIRSLKVSRTTLPVFTRPGNSQLITVGDLNGDHQTDLLWRNKSSGAATAWFMNGATMIGSSPFPQLGDLRGYGVIMADLLGDDAADLIARRSSSGQTKIWQMDGTTLASSVLL